MNIIYAIQINYSLLDGLKILSVKIGMTTTNARKILNRYKTGNPNVRILNLWESNPLITLLMCEKGIHEVAKKYAYERKSRETFIFLENDYDDFAENISLLLKKIKKRTDIPPPGENSDCTGNKPKSFEFNNIRHEVNSWAGLLVILCEEIYKQKGEDFLRVLDNPSFKGKKRPYFSRDKRDLTQSGKKIRGANIYIETGFSALDIIKFCKKILISFGYNDDLAIKISQQKR